jgi:hypothetical protein
MTDEEIKLALFGVGMTMAFLGLRFFLSWDDAKIKFNIRNKN